MDPALSWLRDHALLAWPIVSALLVALLRTRTAAEWVALGERAPRVQGLIKLLRAAGLDPVKAVEGAIQSVTGRTIVDPRDAELARLRAEIARQRDVIAALRATQPEVP